MDSHSAAAEHQINPHLSLRTKTGLCFIERWLREDAETNSSVRNIHNDLRVNFMARLCFQRGNGRRLRKGERYAGMAEESQKVKGQCVTKKTTRRDRISAAGIVNTNYCFNLWERHKRKLILEIDKWKTDCFPSHTPSITSAFLVLLLLLLFCPTWFLCSFDQTSLIAVKYKVNTFSWNAIGGSIHLAPNAHTLWFGRALKRKKEKESLLLHVSVVSLQRSESVDTWNLARAGKKKTCFPLCSCIISSIFFLSTNALQSSGSWIA